MHWHPSLVSRPRYGVPLPPEVAAATGAATEEVYRPYGAAARRWAAWACGVLDGHRAACAARGEVVTEEDGWALLFLAVNAPRCLWDRPAGALPHRGEERMRRGGP
jgi:hypothetical protein